MFTKIKTFFAAPLAVKTSDNDVKPYDLGLLRETVAHNPDSLREIVTLFLQNKPSELVQLEHAVMTRDMQAIARWSHCIKGNLKLFGMNQIYTHLAWIEHVAKKSDNQVWDEEIEVYWQSIRHSFSKVLNELPKELELTPAE